MKVDTKTRDQIGTHCTSMETLSQLINDLRDDLQTKYDDHSEKWQDSETGQDINSTIEELTAIADELLELVERVDQTFDAND
jgi:hypothetical protein